VKEAEKCKDRIEGSIRKMDRTKDCLDRYRRGTAKLFKLGR
jgi:hypothetical protein